MNIRQLSNLETMMGVFGGEIHLVLEAWRRAGWKASELSLKAHYPSITPNPVVTSDMKVHPTEVTTITLRFTVKPVRSKIDVERPRPFSEYFKLVHGEQYAENHIGEQKVLPKRKR